MFAINLSNDRETIHVHAIATVTDVMDKGLPCVGTLGFMTSVRVDDVRAVLAAIDAHERLETGEIATGVTEAGQFIRIGQFISSEMPEETGGRAGFDRVIGLLSAAVAEAEEVAA